MLGAEKYNRRLRSEKNSGPAIGRGFDSPHLHPTPRNLNEIPGFLLRLQRFPPAHCPERMYQDVSGCTIDSGAGVAHAVEKDPAPLDMEEDT